MRGKSGLRKKRYWGNPRGREATESATENIPLYDIWILCRQAENSYFMSKRY